MSAIEHLREGQIVAHWRLTDDVGLQRQLGMPEGTRDDYHIIQVTTSPPG